MLRITMSKSAGGAKKYYSEEYYSEGQTRELDYYSEKEQIIGKWGGKAAEQLGLQANITKKDFGALCDNINPVTGKKLTGRNDADRTVGYDFTFNASKSVSLAYAFANEEDKKAILQAFRDSVKEAMTEVETGMQARVRDKGRNENRETGNIAYGEFIHFTTRPIDGVPDPHLHSHCFVFNATYDGQEKKWKAGQFKQVKQDAPYYEAVFHASLANRLQELGYVVERKENGFELVGVDKTTIDKFSRRTKEIEEHANEHGITDEKEKSQIGAKTRESKRVEIDHKQVEGEWYNRLDREEFIQINSLRDNSKDFRKPESRSNEAAQAVQFSLDHHLERKSVSSDKEILATAIKSCIGAVAPSQVKKEFEGHSGIIKVKEALRTFITTKEAIREEKELIGNANAMKNKFRPINERYEIKDTILNDQQKATVHHALSSTDGIVIITGKAGTGKTTLMKEIKKGIEESGKKIFSFAPSSEASRCVLQSEGFRNADTVASLIQNKAKHNELKNQVIWVDEAGMLSNKDMSQVVEIAKAQNARIVLSGDTKQHNSVERGDALRIIQQYAGIKSATVNKIQRQKNAEYREAVKLLSGGDIEKGFKKLDGIKAIHEVPESSERIKEIAMDYYTSAYKDKEKAKNVLVIAPTHAEGEIVTMHIRQKLKEKDVIGQTDREFATLKNLQFTEAEKQKPENYSKGSVIVFHQNMKGVKAGTRLEVMGHEGNTLLARDKNGIPFNIPVSAHQKFSVFEARKLQATKGDLIRITSNGKTEDGKHLFNGTCYHIHGFDKQGNIRLSNGSTISKDYGHFALGYVMTSHSSQGKTADKVIISQSSATFRAASAEQFYVSVSRGKQAVSIYTDDKATLLQAVNQSSQRISATELLAKSMQQQAASDNSRFSVLNKMKQTAREAIDKLNTNKTNDIQRTSGAGLRKTK